MEGIDLAISYFGPKAAKTIKKYGPLYVRKLAKDPEERQKHCRVCGERIKGGAKFHLTRRFYCKGCGHRTHVSCAESVSRQLCRACAD
jgi:tRNA(Ile2) C34 agmatinyltransferase TiaS